MKGETLAEHKERDKPKATVTEEVPKEGSTHLSESKTANRKGDRN